MSYQILGFLEFLRGAYVNPCSIERVADDGFVLFYESFNEVGSIEKGIAGNLRESGFLDKVNGSVGIGTLTE